MWLWWGVSQHLAVNPGGQSLQPIKLKKLREVEAFSFVVVAIVRITNQQT